MIGDVNGERATPQAPVYATIRPAPSPLNRPAPPALRSSLNSLPSALSSTPLVKSVGAPEEPIKIHPTNPFYTNSPPNSQSSPSKLPIPNGRATYSSLDRSTKSINQHKGSSDYDGLKSPSFFTKYYDSGPSSLPPGTYSATKSENHMMGYENKIPRSTDSEVKHESFSYDNLYSQGISNGLPNHRLNENSSRDPFDTSRMNNDPFEKYLRTNRKEDDSGHSKVSTSLSANNFTEEVTKHSITEHKISEIEEVKTVKKITLNGSGDESHESRFTPTTNQKFDYKNNYQTQNKFEDCHGQSAKRYEYTPFYTEGRNCFQQNAEIANGVNPSADQWNDEKNYSTSSYYSTLDRQHYASPTTGNFLLLFVFLILAQILEINNK